jgi:hypothetical protein
MASADLDTQLDGKATPTNITAGTIATVTDLTNLPTIPANWITSTGISTNSFTAAKFGVDFINATNIAPDACDQIAAHVWRITAANIEADASANTIVNGTACAYEVIVANALEYDVVGSNVVYKNDSGTIIGQRAFTANANTQIITLDELTAG